MRHLFSSGEAMFKKNEKKLTEGLLQGTSLEYDGVELDTWFLCIGKLNGKDIQVRFKISEEEFEGVRSRSNFNILMQSDILQTNWKSYEVI